VSWEPINLGELEERPPVKPTLGGVGLIYPGKRHVFSGSQESAKTLAAYAIALEAIREHDLGVALIDFEMGQWDARDRLREMGATPEDFERLAYVEPDTAATDATIADVIERAPSLVIVDAAAGAYGIQGLDDNKRQDVEAFARAWTQPLFQHGIASLVIDHVTKNAETRGRYAIGSERKVGGADVHLGFETVKPITRGGHGLYKIVTHKDRGGWLPRPRAAQLELHSDPDTHALTWTFKAAEDDTADEAWKPTVLMDRVLEYLSHNPPTSRSALANAVPGKRAYVLQAIDCLIDEHRLTVQDRKVVPVPDLERGNGERFSSPP
jgi:hypothetical protein